MEIHGYKAFHSDMSNMCGLVFEEGKTYTSIGRGGFHYCTKLEDTYPNFFGHKDVRIAEVTGFFDENYPEKFQKCTLQLAHELRVDRILPRKEVMDYILQCDAKEIDDFIMLYALNPEEREYLLNYFANDQKKLDAILKFQKTEEEKNRELLKSRNKTGFVYRPFKKNKK